MLHTAVTYDDGPIALRYPRGEGEGVPIPTQPRAIDIGRGEVLREGERIALLGYGYGVPLALGAADRLLDEHGIEATVADARFAKPLDLELIERAGRRARRGRDDRGERARGRLRRGGGRGARRRRPGRRGAAAALRAARTAT